VTKSNRVLVGAAKMAIRRKFPDHPIPDIKMALSDVPRYLVDRTVVRTKYRRQTEPQPWLTDDAVEHLGSMLKPTDAGLEYGSGGSTIWFGQRVRSVVSVEASDDWYESTTKRAADLGLSNVTVELASTKELGYQTPEHERAYVYAAPSLQPGSLDFVLVDGEYRDKCAMRAIELLKPGGLLILDNANTYIPTPTRTLIQLWSPSTQLWTTFLEKVADWRAIWTSNGCWATVIWVKPSA